jgi:hypothetical protein
MEIRDFKIAWFYVLNWFWAALPLSYRKRIARLLHHCRRRTIDREYPLSVSCLLLIFSSPLSPQPLLMPLDWSKVALLNPPLQTTVHDAIFSGHGTLSPAPPTGTTTVPPNVEIWFLSPPAASIDDAAGQALENMALIKQLGIKNPGSDQLITVTPIRYTAGHQVPNYTLQAPTGIVLKPGGPHLLGVVVDTTLSDLWARLAPLVKPGVTLRCFWAACTSVAGAKNQVVYFR